jgi:hypothetical protein
VIVSGPQALALRRAAMCAAALGASVGAHAAAGDLVLTRAAPIAWLTIVGLALLVGPRRARFRARGPAALIALLVPLQALAHAAMSVAPWAFGLSPHHHGGPDPALLGWGAVAAHLAAALALAALLSWGERLLALALAVAGAVRRALAPVPAGVRPLLRPRPVGTVRLAARVPRSISPRGPPALARR